MIELALVNLMLLSYRNNTRELHVLYKDGRTKKKPKCKQPGNTTKMTRKAKSEYILVHDHSTDCTTDLDTHGDLARMIYVTQNTTCGEQNNLCLLLATEAHLFYFYQPLVGLLVYN
jgi:hypothetical protein